MEMDTTGGIRNGSSAYCKLVCQLAARGGIPLPISLSSFEEYINDVILQRGYDYFKDGRVSWLEAAEQRMHIKADTPPLSV